MTIAQIIVAYSVCWWLVLFMVLPHRVAMEKNPQVGNAPSAPANPRLKRKCLWTTAIAIVPTLIVYFAAQNAKAADADPMLHAGSQGCHKSANYAAADASTKTGGKQVVPADMGGSDAYKGDVVIPIEIPSSNYTNTFGHNVDLSESFIYAGEVKVTPDGKSLLNGKPIYNNEALSGGCDENK